MYVCTHNKLLDIDITPPLIVFLIPASVTMFLFAIILLWFLNLFSLVQYVVESVVMYCCIKLLEFLTLLHEPGIPGKCTINGQRS